MQLSNFLIMFIHHQIKKQSTIAVYLDFSNSVDTVKHEMLMSKLQHNGIKGGMMSWFKPYLSNRKQYVSVKNSSSSMSNITLGVLQGSVLGPVLFLLYINDMHRSTDQMFSVHFDDDTTIFALAQDQQTFSERQQNLIYDNLQPEKCIRH